MLNIVCTSKPADGLLFYSYEYCSNLNDKGIFARLCVVTHRDFTSGDYTKSILDKYIHCKNVEFNNIFVGDDDVSMVLGRSMISLAHMTWNDYSDIQRTSLKNLFKNKIISVYSENHPTIYPEALMRFNPDWVIDLCDTDVYPNGVGEHFEKIIHFPIYKEVEEDIQFDHLFLGTNKEYYQTIQKVIGDYPDHGILTYPQMDLNPENNNLQSPVPNLLGKFKTYVYTKDTFDPAPRIFQECRWLGKEIIYHRTNPVQDGGYWYWKRGLKNQDIGPITTTLNTFKGKIAIYTELASANNKEQFGNLLQPEPPPDFFTTKLDSINNIEGTNLFNYIPKYKKVLIEVSLDGIEKYNNYIKRGTNWEKIYNKITVLNKIPNVQVKINSVVTFFSVLHLYELYTLFPNYLHHWEPTQDTNLKANNLPDDIKDKLIPIYKSIPHLEGITDILKLLPDKNFQPKEIYKYCIEKDEKYKDTQWEMNLWDIFPEIKPHYLRTVVEPQAYKLNLDI